MNMNMNSKFKNYIVIIQFLGIVLQVVSTGLSCTSTGLNTGTCCTAGMVQISDTSGTISEGPENPYADSMKCDWTIGPSSHISFTFSSFDIEQEYDSVTLYSCSDIQCSSKNQIGYFEGSASRPSEGSNRPPVLNTQYVVTTGYMRIVFRSDSTVSFVGFIGTWNAAVNCPEGTYSAADHASCVSCPGNSSSPAGSSAFSACVCNIGYEGNT